jgi:predicted nuclease of predicted toxin-antitoxin system
MRLKFQADADLDARVLRALKRAAPEIDVRTASEAGLEGLPDSEVLRIAAGEGRVLLSQDRRTMPAHFNRFVTQAESPGVILLREGISIAAAVDELVLIWSASEAGEWKNRLMWIPL